MPFVTPSAETYQRVVGLRVVRGYSNLPIDAEDMTAVLEAARWTGSSKNRQGWEFIVVTGERLSDLATAGRFTQPIRDSAATIALIETPEGNPFDIGRVAQNIMLAAAARGIGSCPITLHDGGRAKTVLELPDGYGCSYAVALGHPDPDAEQAQRERRRAEGMSGRTPLDELVHHQRYGASREQS